MFTGSILKERLQQRPFVPFRIITTPGDRYDVRHPDLVLVGKNYLIVGTAAEDNPGLFDRVTHVSILHIAALEELPTGTPKGSNGQG